MNLVHKEYHEISDPDKDTSFEAGDCLDNSYE